jgi:hypothetical protein
MQIYRENVNRLDPERKLPDFAVPTLAIGDKWRDAVGNIREVANFSTRNCISGDLICYKFHDKAEYPCWALDKYLLEEQSKPKKELKMKITEFLDTDFEVIGFTKNEVVLLSKLSPHSVVLNMKDIQRLLTKMICQYGDSDATKVLEDNLTN